MSKLLQPHAFVDGVAIVTDHLNDVLVSTNQGVGIVSEPNGGLGQDNLKPGFAIRQEHIQPEQVILSRFDGAVSTLDNWHNVSGRSTEDVDLEIPTRQALPGCGIRVYVPHEVIAIRWNISWFWYVTRFFGLITGDPDTSAAQEVRTHVFIDGEEIEALRRTYPLTWFKKSPDDYTAAGSNESPWSTEAEQASHTNLSWLQTNADPTAPTFGLPAGFHEAYLGFYVKPLDEEYMLRENLRNFRNVGITDKAEEMGQRFSVGCRSARVVAFR
jgi:hypothetical protein